jgi:hypothetical protein
MWGGGTRFVVLAIVAVGLVLVANGHTLVGITILVTSIPVSWFTGMWTIPGTVDSYFIKMSNIINESFTNLHSDNLQLRQRLRDTTVRMRGLDPPQRRMDLHGRVIADVGRIEEVLDDKSVAFADRAVGLLQPSQSLIRAHTELESERGEAYGKAMVVLLARYKQNVDESRKRNTQSLRRLVERAETLRRPDFLRDRHSEYLGSLNAYVSCMTNYYEATQDGDIEAVRSAAEATEIAQANLETKSHAYFAELLAKSHHRLDGEGKIDVAK